MGLFMIPLVGVDNKLGLFGFQFLSEKLNVFFNWFTGLANATAILEESYQEYPNSAVFLFFRGLVSRLKVGSVSYLNLVTV